MEPHSLFLRALQQRFGTRPSGVKLQSVRNTIPNALQQEAKPTQTQTQTISVTQGMPQQQTDQLMANPLGKNNFLPIHTAQAPFNPSQDAGYNPYQQFLLHVGIGKQNPNILNQPEQQNIKGITTPTEKQDVTSNTINTPVIPQRSVIQSNNAVIPLDQMGGLGVPPQQ